MKNLFLEIHCVCRPCKKEAAETLMEDRDAPGTILFGLLPQEVLSRIKEAHF